MGHCFDNLFLETLPQPYRTSLCSRLEMVTLSPGAVLYEAEQVPRYAFFITSGLASKMVAMSDGRTAEIGLTGSEGVVPCYQLLGGEPTGPARCVVQMKVTAWRIPFPELKREVERSETLRHLVMKCAQRRSMILSQIAACNRLHEAEERLARWLLTAHDLTGAPGIPLNHGLLADILGARRTTVTLAAGALRRRKLISVRRGQLQILDGPRMRDVACECYATLRNLFRNYYG